MDDNKDYNSSEDEITEPTYVLEHVDSMYGQSADGRPEKQTAQTDVERIYGQREEQPQAGEVYGYITLRDRILNPSTIVSLIAAVFLVLGLTMPIIDFSVFNESINIRYNMIKICQNVRLLSPIWIGIPYVVAAGIVLLVLLSFVNIPPLKVIPFVLIVVAYVIALADVNNVITWGNELVDRFLDGNDIDISNKSIIDGIMCGAYFTAAGLLLNLISCFIKGARLRRI